MTDELEEYAYLRETRKYLKTGIENNTPLHYLDNLAGLHQDEKLQCRLQKAGVLNQNGYGSGYNEDTKVVFVENRMLICDDKDNLLGLLEPDGFTPAENISRADLADIYRDIKDIVNKDYHNDIAIDNVKYYPKLTFMGKKPYTAAIMECFLGYTQKRSVLVHNNQVQSSVKEIIAELFGLETGAPNLVDSSRSSDNLWTDLNKFAKDLGIGKESQGASL